MIRLVIIVALCLTGCAGTARSTKVIHTVEKTTAQAPVTAPDGSVSMVPVVTVRELWQDESEHVETSSGPDMQRIAAAVQPVAQVVAGATGMGWGQVAGGALALVTATATAWAARGREVVSERKRADDHKADAEEGWKKADAYARQLPPDTKV